MRLKITIFALIWASTWTIEANAQTKFLQRGFGSSIASSQSDRMVGLHPTYPKGTRLLVKNTANGSTIVVKIIGTLPNTAEHEKLIIRLSQAACNSLHATGKRFSVELYTAPPEDEPLPQNPPKDSTKKKEPEKLEEGVIIHKVAAGETLYSISRKYKVTVEKIKEWNKLDNNNLLKGQKLRIMKF